MGAPSRRRRRDRRRARAAESSLPVESVRAAPRLGRGARRRAAVHGAAAPSACCRAPTRPSVRRAGVARARSCTATGSSRRAKERRQPTWTSSFGRSTRWCSAARSSCCSTSRSSACCGWRASSPTAGRGGGCARGAARWGRSYRARLSLALFAFFVIPALAFAVWIVRTAGDGRDAVARAARGRDAARPSSRAPARSPWLRERERASRHAAVAVSAAASCARRAIRSTTTSPRRAGFSRRKSSRRSPSTPRKPPPRSSRWATPRRCSGTGRSTLAPLPPVVIAAPARADDAHARSPAARSRRARAVRHGRRRARRALAERRRRAPARAARSVRCAQAALSIAGGSANAAARVASRRWSSSRCSRAFRRMAADLNASRAALEEAQRRTAAVLRNVASGVVAVDARAARHRSPIRAPSSCSACR